MVGCRAGATSSVRIVPSAARFSRATLRSRSSGRYCAIIPSHWHAALLVGLADRLVEQDLSVASDEPYGTRYAAFLDVRLERIDDRCELRRVDARPRRGLLCARSGLTLQTVSVEPPEELNKSVAQAAASRCMPASASWRTRPASSSGCAAM